MTPYLLASSPQTQTGAPPQGSMLAMLVPFILVFVIFYFLIIMPQRKRQKKHQGMVESLKPGDRIITSGGIFGSVMGVQKDRIELKVASNVKIDITKSSVAVILGAESSESGKTD